MSDSRIDEELVARGSRTHGTREQRQDRLQRFLDFEDQKQRRARYVQEQREALYNNARMEQVEDEMDGQQDKDRDECDSNCECDEARAARTLLGLRNDIDTLTQLIPRLAAVERAFIDLDESYEVMVAENLRLNHRINNLEMRLSHVENRSDSPPPMMTFPESNPMWKLEEFHQY
jgi:cell division septum initiation protein DivIVA